MKHYSKEIREDPNALGEDALHHIRNCSECRLEMNIMKQIISAVETMPHEPVPEILKERIMQKIQRPVFRIWHLILASLLLMFSPFSLKYALQSYSGLFLDQYIIILVSIFFGLATILLVIPVAIRIYQNHKRFIEKMHILCDNFIDQRINSPS